MTAEKEKKMIKDDISEVDNSLLKDLFYVSQMALNDLDTLKRVSVETGMTEQRIEALIPVAIDLSMDQRPDITTEDDLQKLMEYHQQLKQEFSATK